MWGSDYPHIEGTWPRTRETLSDSLGDRSPAVIAPLVGSTAATVYDFDDALLAEVAGRVGPEVGQLSTVS